MSIYVHHRGYLESKMENYLASAASSAAVFPGSSALMIALLTMIYDAPASIASFPFPPCAPTPGLMMGGSGPNTFRISVIFSGYVAPTIIPSASHFRALRANSR